MNLNPESEYETQEKFITVILSEAMKWPSEGSILYEILRPRFASASE